jgi:hypothetical protein
MDYRILFSSSTPLVPKENRGRFQAMKTHIVESLRGRVRVGQNSQGLPSSQQSSSSLFFFNRSHADNRLGDHREPGLSELDANSASLLIILLLCGTFTQFQAEICLHLRVPVKCGVGPIQPNCKSSHTAVRGGKSVKGFIETSRLT